MRGTGYGRKQEAGRSPASEVGGRPHLAPTAGDVIVLSLRAGALTPCGPILWWSSLCTAFVLVH